MFYSVSVSNSVWPTGRPIWTTCFQCRYRGDKTYCNKCIRNSFAPSGEGKSDKWEGNKNEQ